MDIDKLNMANLVGKVMDEIMEYYQSLSIILIIYFDIIITHLRKQISKNVIINI